MRKAEPFFTHVCHKCGLIDEAKFVWAGPHIKQVCNGCDFYVKFFDKSKIPDVRVVKEKIWFITEGDISVIDAAKQKMAFIKSTGLTEKVLYWRLYLIVREL